MKYKKLKEWINSPVNCDINKEDLKKSEAKFKDLKIAPNLTLANLVRQYNRLVKSLF